MYNQKVLIVVDAQNDFMPGGALAVPNGEEIIPVINSLLPEFDLVVFTKDWHPENHKSFASQHPDRKVFDTVSLNGIDQILWPDHCIQNTPGSEIHPDIDFGRIPGNFYIFKKGLNSEVDSYSGFYDNDRQTSTGLSEFLRERGITDVYVVGLALDFCAAYTAIDAAIEGFNTYVIQEGTRPINSDIQEVLRSFEKAGVNVL
jgi:nicotinamidase/pyrazinamidase